MSFQAEADRNVMAMQMHLQELTGALLPDLRVLRLQDLRLRKGRPEQSQPDQLERRADQPTPLLQELKAAEDRAAEAEVLQDHQELVEAN